MNDYDVIVIGAGCGGLTAGALLSGQGRKVLVLEQSGEIGGCCSSYTRAGYTFDVGASIVEAVYVIDQAFGELGTSAKAELDLIPCDPIYTSLSRDGARITYPLSMEKAIETIAAVSPADAARFRDYAAYFQKFLSIGDDYFTSPASTMTDMLRMLLRKPGMLRFVPLFFQSYEDVMRKYFRDEKILESMTYQSYYFGHPPDLTPGLFAVVPCSEHEGIFYPRGGMIQIPAAIRRVGERRGLEVRLNQRVSRVLVRERRACGVRLADGTEITARLVVSNINAKTLYLDLIGEEHLPRLTRYGIKSYAPSMSCPMMYIGLDKAPPLESHHTIFPLPLAEMDRYSWIDYPAGRLPKEQFGIIAYTTLTDPSLAPAGHHVINLTLMGPYKLLGTDWDAEKPRFQEEVIKFLSRFAIPDLEKHVTTVEMTTPLDFERRLLHPGGAIYGLQQDITAQTVFRPSARSRAIKGLYLVGASTHPGGGVPTTIGSGIIAGELIKKYEN